MVKMMDTFLGDFAGAEVATDALMAGSDEGLVVSGSAGNDSYWSRLIWLGDSGSPVDLGTFARPAQTAGGRQIRLRLAAFGAKSGSSKADVQRSARWCTKVA